MKNILSWIALIALFYGIYWFWSWQTSNFDELKRTGELTIGTIESYGDNVITEYEVNGETFKRKRSQPFGGLQDGEQYYVAYNPTNPEEYVVIYECPYINDSTQFEVTSTTGFEHSWDSELRFKFEFQVNNKKYSRIQKVTDRTEYPESQTYRVIYKKSNPRMAYLIK